VITTESWPSLAAPLLNACALLLALGFRRNRAVLVLAVLTCASLALAGIGGPLPGERGSEALRMFAPWLLFGAAALPERRLMARRNLLLFGLLAFSAWLTLMAPAHIWPGLREAFPLGWLPWSKSTVAIGLVLIAAALCLLRWIVQSTLIEAALGIMLVLVGIAMLPAARFGAASDLLALAGGIALIAILFASYRMAFVDGLAGLPNRRALDEALARLSGDYALAMVDVDHFKSFNDRHGHEAGDRVLRAIAEQLRMTRGANAYRYGGEEFCLLFTGSRVRHAKESCEELRANVADMRVAVRSGSSAKRPTTNTRKSPGEVKVTISIGLSERSDALRTTNEVLKAADAALYKAKSGGRNRVVSR
jgi:diguanylate cyclase (GGDEF)-like protein